jgi:hypothetical protein
MLNIPTPPENTTIRLPDPQTTACIELLAETFPKCFAIYEARRKPLKIGIHLDILAAFDGAVTPIELSRALRRYTGNKLYQSRLRAGAIRVDLNGDPAGTVTPEQAVTPRPRSPKTTPAPSPKSTPSRLTLSDLRKAGKRRAMGDAS